MDDLFAACDRYELDPDLASMREREPPSCVDCRWQYAPGHVCAAFQRRLFGMVPTGPEAQKESDS